MSLVITCIDLRLRPSDLLVASDSSSHVEAAVVAEVGQSFTAEAQRHGLQKGLWNRLLGPSAAYLREHAGLQPEDELPERSYDMHPLWEEVCTTKQFRVFGPIKKRQRRKHINLGEVSAALSAEREIGILQPDSYYVHLQDSQVALACLVKGRSSSFELNKLLRRSIPDHAGQNIKAFYGFVRSKLNPADDPTRGADVRPPSRAPAEWWGEIEENSFDGFDSFLERQGCLPSQISGLPDASEFWPDSELDLRNSREAKRDRLKKLAVSELSNFDSHKACDTAPGETVNLTLVPSSSMSAQSPCRATAVFGPREGNRGSKEQHHRLALDPFPISSAGETSASSVPGSSTTAQSPRRATVIFGPEATGESERGPEGEDRAFSHGKRQAEFFSGWGSEKDGSEVQELFSELLKFKRSQFQFSKKFSNLEEALKSGPGLLDLFAGARGFSKAFVRKHQTWSLSFDLKDGEDEDLLDPWLQKRLLKLLRTGAFRAMAASPVCASFSTAITPPWRSREFPGGKPGLTAEQNSKIELGHKQLAFTLKVVEACLTAGVIFWVENPDGSWFWKQEGELCWDSILQNKAVGDFRIDQCRFRTRWRKRTRFRTNSSLAGQRVLCECLKPHVVLRGKVPGSGINFTKLAESYPRALCEILATAMGQDCGLLPGRRKLSADGCARCCGKRIGEAQNPGPRRKAGVRKERIDRLEDYELLEPQTIAMRQRFWKSFEAWLFEELGDDCLDHLLTVPMLMVKALETYASVEYAAGTPLHYYRQLLCHVQREYPLTKPYMGLAWAAVSRWELAEPGQHRAPLPEPLLRSMAALGILWGWKTFAATLLLCFYGICRIGEVLNARRLELLTPDDLLADEQILYLRIERPKSRKRGPKVQYATVNEPDVVRFLTATWQSTSSRCFLYAGSATTFRRRWDKILECIGVQKFHRLTPGSLRGGGCVWAHKKGMQIQDLCWRMRLQHTKTLGFYLQETTAGSVLPSLSAECRYNIQALRALLPILFECTG